MAESFRVGVVGSGYVGQVTGSSEVRPVNIANPQEHIVRSIADPVVEHSGGTGEIVHEPPSEDDPERRCPEIMRVRDALGWEPRVGVRQRVEKALEWVAGRMGASETPLAPKP